MAAAMLAAPVVDAAAREAREFARNPWDYLADLLIELGAVLALVGVALGFVGYYLKAYSVKAKGDASQAIASVESVFGNISFDASQQPYLSVTGPNIANDIVNLGNDAVRFLTNTASQAWGDLKGIATAIDDIPKALVQAISQGPSIVINGFLGLVAEALADVFILIFPYAIIFGAAMLGAGIVMRALRYLFDAYIAPEVSEWVGRRIGAPLRSFIHRLINPDAPGGSSVVGATGVPAQVAPSPAQGPGDSSFPPPAGPPTPEAPPPPAPPALNTSAQTSHEKGGGEAPTPAETLPAVPTEQVEAQLGDAYTTAKDRMRSALRRRREAPRDQDYVGWAYSRIRATA
jgi:hypothetical protein